MIDFSKPTPWKPLIWDPDWVTAVTFIGSTRKLAAGNNLGEIILWDLPEKPGDEAPIPVRKLTGHTNVVSKLLSTTDGRWLISSSYDHTIRIWDMTASASGSAELVLNARTIADAEARKANGAKVPKALPAKVELQTSAHVIGLTEWVTSIVLSKDGQQLASGDDSRQVVIWNLADRRELKRIKVKGWVQALGMTPDFKRAIISERIPLVFDSGRHAGLRIWDVEKASILKELGAEYKEMYLGSVAYSADGKMIAAGRGGEASGLSGVVFLLDSEGKKLKEFKPGHLDGLTDLAFHPDGKHILSSGRDTMVRIWNTESGKQVAELGKSRGGQSKDWICAISISASGDTIAGADMAGAVQIWSFANAPGK
jgi:WD40 repeat protein